MNYFSFEDKERKTERKNEETMMDGYINSQRTKYKKSERERERESIIYPVTTSDKSPSPCLYYDDDHGSVDLKQEGQNIWLNTVPKAKLTFRIVQGKL